MLRSRVNGRGRLAGGSSVLVDACGGALPAPAAAAIQTSGENRDDSEHVFNKLGFGCWGGARLITCVHNDCRSVSVTKVFDEIECKPAEPVSVGNMNCSYTPLMDEFQKRLEAFSFEVEAACDVGEDSTSGVSLSESLDLGIKVIPLLARGDTRVHDVLALSAVAALCLLDNVKAVAVSATRPKSPYRSSTFPTQECLATHTEVSCRHACRHVRHHDL